MTQDEVLVPPGRVERLLADPVLTVAVWGLCLLLAAIGYAFDLEVLTGLSSWVGGCAFVLMWQAYVAHRHNRRERYSPRNLDRLREYEAPPLP